MTENKRTVSLVLGSGGARGLAHIGVIHWLEQHDFEVQSISGSSIGALVGGFYAAGKLDIYTEWVKALRRRDVLRLLDFAFSRSGLFSGDRIMVTLKELLGDAEIENLPIKFTAVAMDLESDKEVWINSGSLFEAIRASISVPTIFTPVRSNGQLLVDGGLVNPIPIAPTVMNSTGLTIAVNLSGEPVVCTQAEEEEEDNGRDPNSYQARIARFIDGLQSRFTTRDSDAISMYEVLTRSLESMQNTIARFKLAAYTPDYIIEIPSNACRLMEFNRAKEMIALGYQRAQHTLGKSFDIEPKDNAQAGPADLICD